MDKLTYAELTTAFRAVEQNERGEHIYGCIVFAEDSFMEPCSLAARTYRVSSDNEAFRPNAETNAIIGSSLDGTDVDVRLEWYMAEECGRKDGWRVEYCYISNIEEDLEDYI